MLTKAQIFAAICLIVGFTACKKQAPQLPSNKVVVVNTDAASLLTINQDLARKEDISLQKFAASKDKSFKRSEVGFWYKIDQSGKGAKVQTKTTCKFSSTLTLLNGKLIENKEKEVVLGKKQLIVGLEEGIKLLQHGDSATIIIPWYIGYGMKGQEGLVPGYTSVIYHIRIH